MARAPRAVFGSFRARSKEVETPTGAGGLRSSVLGRALTRTLSRSKAERRPALPSTRHEIISTDGSAGKEKNRARERRFADLGSVIGPQPRANPGGNQAGAVAIPGPAGGLVFIRDVRSQLHEVSDVLTYRPTPRATVNPAPRRPRTNFSSRRTRRRYRYDPRKALPRCG